MRTVGFFFNIHWLKWLMWVGIVGSLSSCFDEFDMSTHPCEACRPCEECVQKSDEIVCRTKEENAYLRCGGEGVHRFNSCDEDQGMAQKCPEHSSCVDGGLEGTDAFCRCHNAWYGENCDKCPSHYDKYFDCSVCKGNWDLLTQCQSCRNHWTDDDNHCSTCPENWDADQDCAICSNHWQGANCDICPGNWDEETNCSVCLNHWEDSDDNCGTCPGNWDAQLNCAACRTHWDPETLCTTCIGNWDQKKDCNECVNHFDPTSNCEECLPNWEKADNCASCMNFWDPATDCTQCLTNFDPTTECTQCLGNWDMATSCETCINNYDPTTDCKRCLPNYDLDTLCTQCLNNWDVSQNCTACLPNYDPARDCAVCVGHWDLAHSCSICLPHWDIETNCESCLGNWDVSQFCSSCLGNWDLATNCTECRNEYFNEDNNCGSCPSELAEAEDCLDSCGNGYVGKLEACDDENLYPWDGCNECQLSPIQVAPDLEGDAYEPVIDVASSGEGLIVWQLGGQGEETDIWGRLFLAEGGLQGEPFRINTARNGQTVPALAATRDNQFVVVWQSEDQDGDGAGVYGQRLENDGTKLGTEFRINTTTLGDQHNPTVTAWDEGGFAVVWLGSNEDTTWLYDVFVQYYDGDGQPVYDEIKVNERFAPFFVTPAVSSKSGGGLFIAWYTIIDDMSLIVGRRVNAMGQTVGKETVLNQYFADFQSDPSLSTTPDGDVLVSWDWMKGETGQERLSSVVFRIFDTDGVPTTDEITVSADTSDYYFAPCSAINSAGQIAIVWWGEFQTDPDQYIYNARGRWYDSGTNPVTTTQSLADYTEGQQRVHDIAALPDGSFVPVWSGKLPNGTETKVVYRRFSAMGEPLP